MESKGMQQNLLKIDVPANYFYGIDNVSGKQVLNHMLHLEREYKQTGTK